MFNKLICLRYYIYHNYRIKEKKMLGVLRNKGSINVIAILDRRSPCNSVIFSLFRFMFYTPLASFFTPEHISFFLEDAAICLEPARQTLHANMFSFRPCLKTIFHVITPTVLSKCHILHIAIIKGRKKSKKEKFVFIKCKPGLKLYKYPELILE